MIPKLSRELDAGGWRRLTTAWADPEVTTADVVTRFRLCSKDLPKIEAVLGPKVRSEPFRPRWRERKLKFATRAAKATP